MKKGLFMYIFILILMGIGIKRLFDICITKSYSYKIEYNNVVNREFRGMNAPRGRILDVNGKVLVDNVGVNTLIYNKLNNSIDSEIDISLRLAEILSIEENNITEYRLKTFYLVTHNNGKDLITEKEYNLWKNRRLSTDELEELKYERITTDILNTMNDIERKASYIYSIISNGYAFQNKIIKKGLTDEEVASISNLNLKGITIELTWERIYPYGDVLRSIFGSVSNNSLPKELKDYYMNKGLTLDSSVGTSGLELQYDDYLRGTDTLYKIDQLGNITLLENEKQGNDLYLTIDIDKQLKVESILKEEMLLAKKAKNTEYYNHSFVIVGHPLTGEIVAMVGLELSKDHFIDITSMSISSSYTVGSIVKGASMSVGYKNNLITKGKYITDGCVKVLNVEQKCSWRKLGVIDDIRAMALSSNYYQFMIAINLANPNYTWNSKLNATQDHFDNYRNIFASYGLGAITGIDLPNERIGIIGKTISDDLLLNLAIGQYDTYTPMEVFQYINSIANNGTRLAPSLMSKITNDTGIIKERENKVLNNAILNEEDIKRVQLGMREVMKSGTGYGYGLQSIPSAGKTGTSETFVDTNGDGKIDTKTISTAFVMYAPFDNPEYSIVLISPNISVEEGQTSYKYSLNLRVNRKIVEYLFEKD